MTSEPGPSEEGRSGIVARLIEDASCLDLVRASEIEICRRDQELFGAQELDREVLTGCELGRVACD